jgi:hypothetical protein
MYLTKDGSLIPCGYCLTGKLQARIAELEANLKQGHKCNECLSSQLENGEHECCIDGSDICGFDDRIADLEQQLRWIPVSEAPKPSEHYDIILISEDEGMSLLRSTWERDAYRYFEQGDEFTLTDIQCLWTHWMPIPPLPDKKESE